MGAPDEALRKECWENAIHSYGTFYIFERRHRRLRRAQLLITYWGILVPLVAGGTLLSFGRDLPGLPVLIAVSSLVLLVQLALSAWSAIAGWADRLAYAAESAVANDRLARTFADLGRNPPNGSKFRTEVDWLKKDDAFRRERDLAQNISEKEKRMGLRAALRQFQRPCLVCKIIPTSMAPSTCGACGNF